MTTELIGAKTGNCLRAAIALEEAGLEYTARPLDLRQGEHRDPVYMRLNPEGKVPTLVVTSRDAPAMVLSQSNAIMLYAATVAPGRLLPTDDGPDKWRAYERYFFFVTDVVAPSLSGFHLRAQGEAVAGTLLQDRAIGAMRSADRFASQTPFMAGEAFGLADAAAVPMVLFLEDVLDWPSLPNLRRWLDTVRTRAGVERGMKAFDTP